MAAANIETEIVFPNRLGVEIKTSCGSESHPFTSKIFWCALLNAPAPRKARKEKEMHECIDHGTVFDGMICPTPCDPVPAGLFDNLAFYQIHSFHQTHHICAYVNELQRWVLMMIHCPHNQILSHQNSGKYLKVKSTDQTSFQCIQQTGV
eukprot:2650653-Rhodomonas_salina.1